MSHELDLYYEAIGERESGGDYKVVNNIGFLGKYQMGEMALVDAGYYKPKANIRIIIMIVVNVLLFIPNACNIIN